MIKTQCIILGNLKYRFKKISGIKTINDAVSCLEIYVDHNKSLCYKLNWINFMKTWKGFSSHGEGKINNLW